MDLLPVAQIVKSYDVNGEVVIRMTSSILDDYNFKKEPVYIFFDGLPVPFFISSFKTKGSNGALVKFETINDFSHSEELVKREIFVDSTSVDPDSIDMDEDEAMAAFLTGFKDHGHRQRHHQLYPDAHGGGGRGVCGCPEGRPAPGPG